MLLLHHFRVMQLFDCLVKALGCRLGCMQAELSQKFSVYLDEEMCFDVAANSLCIQQNVLPVAVKANTDLC